ncbi:hypothetical protein FS837_002194 [Tulasnella sp. UAMH 9824]|nr:hypothetical protein FS837_002194 [Tulasnella sp. UAMH 9824]
MTARAKVPLRAGVVHKFLMNKEYGSVVNQLNADLHRAIQEFMMKGGAATEAAVEETLQTVQAGFSGTRSDIKTAHTEISNDLAAVSEGVCRIQSVVQELNQHSRTWSDHVAARIDTGFAGVSNDVQPLEAVALNQHLLLLPRAEARYDSRSRQDANGCLAGTRTKVLEEIYDWINSTDPESPSIFWLCGLAGIGKSTIAHTIAEETDADRRLGASFFFSRDEADRRNAQLVYPTIASQLARLDHELKKLIASAVERDQDVGKLVMKKQFEKLISEPLVEWRGAKGTIVIVMDALDECSPESGAEEILIRWAAELPRIQVPLRVLITSRPEFHIRRKFQSLSLRAISQPYILHDIEKSVVKNDIELFLRQRLNQVAEDYGVQTPWPSEAVLRKLVDRAGILFIYASTVVKFVQDCGYLGPETSLGLLLANETSGEASEYRDIDVLYTQVLRNALSANKRYYKSEDKMKEAFSTVLGAIILLRDPLSGGSLECLLSLNTGTIRMVLLHLHSVLVVPERAESEIRLLHPSFHDFLTSPDRCPDDLHVDPQENHVGLAVCCLHVLIKDLRHDPCQVGNLWLDNDEIPNLPDRLEKSIPMHVRYACRHFAFHLSQASPKHTVLANLLEEFCNKQLLLWVEILSLLSEVDTAVLSLQRVQDWYKDVPEALEETFVLLHDANRMVMEFGRGIRRSSGHIYTSALPFSPFCQLKAQYGGTLGPDYVTQGLSTFWSPNYCSIELPDTVESITYSPDGSMIAVGTKRGGIYVFNSTTGAEIITIQSTCQCNQGFVSVTFAPDGSRLAFTSSEWVHIHDVTAGALLSRLGDSTMDTTVRLGGVMFASDGIKVIASSISGVLLVWDSQTGDLISRRSGDGFRGDKKSVALMLSPDRATIARPAIKDGIEIWDWDSYHPLRTLRFAGVHYGQVQFLTDNVRLAAKVSGSAFNPRSWAPRAGELHIWDYQKGICLQQLSVDGPVFVSPFGDYMAGCTEDASNLQIWNTKTWSVAGDLFRDNPNSGIDLSLAFSPIGYMLALSPSTTQIDVWEFSRARLGQDGTHFPRHDSANGPRALAVSADGFRVAYNIGHKLRVWDLAHGSSGDTLTLYTLEFLTFSPDGQQLMGVEVSDAALQRTTLNPLRESLVKLWKIDSLPDKLLKIDSLPDKLWDTESLRDKLWDTQSLPDKLRDTNSLEPRDRSGLGSPRWRSLGNGAQD